MDCFGDLLPGAVCAHAAAGGGGEGSACVVGRWAPMVRDQDVLAREKTATRTFVGETLAVAVMVSIDRMSPDVRISSVAMGGCTLPLVCHRSCLSYNIPGMM